MISVHDPTADAEDPVVEEHRRVVVARDQLDHVADPEVAIGLGRHIERAVLRGQRSHGRARDVLDLRDGGGDSRASSSRRP